MRIEVRQEHIDKAGRGEGDNCPIFWAAVAAGLDMEYVESSEIVWWDGFVRYRAEIPAAIGRLIDDYDEGHAMRPFYFHTGEPKPLEESEEEHDHDP